MASFTSVNGILLRTAKAMPEERSTECSSNRGMKRKAHEIEEAEYLPGLSGSRVRLEHGGDLNNGKGEERNSESTIDPSVPNNFRRPSDSSSSSAFRSTSAEGRNDDRESIRRSSFTSISRGVGRKHNDSELTQRNTGNEGKERDGSQEVTAKKGTFQDRLGGDSQHLPEADENLLLATVAEVEAMFAKEKWDLVAQAMKRAGAAEHSIDSLERAFAALTRISPNISVTNTEFPGKAWNDILYKICEVPGVKSVSTSKIPNDSDSLICSITRMVTPPIGQTSTQAVIERLSFRILPTETLENTQTESVKVKPATQDRTKVKVSEPAKSPLPNYQGFGILVNKESLRYNAQQIPQTIRARMNQQRRHFSTQENPNTSASSQKTTSGALQACSTISTEEASRSQQYLQGPLTCPKSPQEMGQQQVATQAEVLAQPQLPITRKKPSMPTHASLGATHQGQTTARPRKAISKSQLKYMLRHRTLNEINKHKSWDAIAQECGVDAPLNEISQALEQAGFPGILYTPTGAPIFVSNPASSAATSQSSIAYVSSYPSNSAASPATDRTTPQLATPVDLNKDDDALISTNSTTAAQATQNSYLNAEERYPSIPQAEPVQKKDEDDQLLDSHEMRSAATRKAWAKRQSEGRNGRHGTAPRSSTIARNALIGGSPTVFTAQVLAAAATEAEAAPPSESTPQDIKTESPVLAQITLNESSNTDLSSQGQRRTRKKRGPYKNRNVASTEELTQSMHQPYQNLLNTSASDEKLCPFACDKCGKAYTTPGGLNWHRASKPHCELDVPKPRPYACEKCGKSYQNKGGLSYHKQHYLDCEAEALKPDKKTDPPEQKEVKKLAGPRIVGGARINILQPSATALKTQETEN